MKLTRKQLVKLIKEELEGSLEEGADVRQKASRAIAMANQHLKQVTNIVAGASTGQALSGIEGSKAKDQLQQAIEQLQGLADHLQDITGARGGLETALGVGDRGPQDAAVRQDVNPRPIRTRRGGTPRK